MTDLEICQKIAEIEGVASSIDLKISQSINDGFCESDFLKWEDLYNPLTDKALCFDLMIKHGVNIDLASCKNKGKYVAMWEYTMEFDGGTSYGDTPQRAICLAIIAKHEGLNND